VTEDRHFDLTVFVLLLGMTLHSCGPHSNKPLPAGAPISAPTSSIAVPASPRTELPLLPLPKELELKSGSFRFGRDNRIVVQEGAPDTARDVADQVADLFYGVMTLRQLAALDAARKHRTDDESWAIPALDIRDAPRFRYRGLRWIRRATSSLSPSSRSTSSSRRPTS
jgi:hypothetical protein